MSADGVSLQLAFIVDQVRCAPVPAAFREEIRNHSYEAIWKPWIERVGPKGAEAFNEVAKIMIDMGYTVPGYTPY